MNIIMSYIDHNTANLDQREKFSFTKQQMDDIYKKIVSNEDILGAVIISTCNRTEIYLSEKDSGNISPFEILCETLNLNHEEYVFISKTLTGDDAIVHLCKLAAGAESQIWGEDQIISQVREAVLIAREGKYSDTILNVVFRTAVSAGKKVKTLVDFKVDDDSTAKRAVNILKKYPEIKNVLVIGNGMIGRLAAEILVKEGFNPVMTLRQYKHGANVVPCGVDTVNYGDRYKKMESVEGVISATLSPHHTVDYEFISQLENIPKVFVDLAVPRDIDPKVEELPEVKYYNIDDISKDSIKQRKEKQIEEIDTIIQKYIDDFYKWYDYREKLEMEK
ncbi:MAG: glutamyl-tRNA reductase [Anaerovoracaceae bacterium]